MTLMEFSIFPVDKGVSLSPYVARCLTIVQQSGLEYRLHAMGTVVEGEIDQLLALLQQCFDALSADCERLSCTVKFDYRKGEGSRMQSKLESVQARCDRPLRT